MKTQKISLFFRPAHGLGAHLPSFSMDIGELSAEIKRPVDESDTHLYQVPRLRMSAAILLLCL